MNILVSQPLSSVYLNNLCYHLAQLDHFIVGWNTSQSLFSVLDNIPTCKPNLLLCEYDRLTTSTLEAISEYGIPTVTFGHYKEKKTNHNIKVKCLTKLDVPNLFPEDFSDYLYLAPAANIPDKSVRINNEKSFLYLSDIDSPTIRQLLEKNIPIRIIGQKKLPYIEYLGQITTSERMSMCKNCCPIILNDIMYMYDVAISKGFAIIGEDNSLYPEFKNVDELILHLQNIPSQTTIIEKAYEAAKLNTFYHRLAEIFTKLELKEEAKKCLNQLSKVLVS